MSRPRSKSVQTEEPKTKSYHRRKSCPDCESTDIMFDTDTEQIICHDCGLLFEELVESSDSSDELDLF